MSGRDLREAQPGNPASGVSPVLPAIERLLFAVVEASRCMVEHENFEQGLRAAMEALGSLSGHDRAYAWKLTQAGANCDLIAEWDAPGIGHIGELMGTQELSLPVSDYLEVWTPLLAGRAYQSVTPVKTGANAALNESVGNRSDVMVPIVVHGKVWGCVGFDNCREERRYNDTEVQVLRGAAAAIAAAVARSEAEHERRATAARAEALLAAVTEATKHLVAEADLEVGLQRAADALRTRIGIDRVVLTRYAPEERAAYLWLESRSEDVPPFTVGFGSGPLLDDTYPEVAKPLLAGRVYRSRASERVGAKAEANRIIESGSDLIVPLFVGGAYRGCLGFDTSSDARDWTEGEVAVLETAANAVAAALGRHDVEVERRTQSAQQATEAKHLNQLLEGVVRASRALMDADDFQTGLERWLEFIARGVDADAAMLGELRSSSDANVATTSARWGRRTISPAIPTVPATTDFVAWAARLEQGESIWAHIDELEDPASVQFWRETDCETNLLTPVVAQGATIGWVGFDWSKRCEWRPAYATILRTAADGLAAAIGRHRALQATLAEREHRVALERARADEAAAYAEKKDRSLNLLSAVAASAEDLLRAGDPMECMERVLERIGTITRAQRACLGMVDWTSEDGDDVWLSLVAEWTSAENIRQLGGPMHRFSISRAEQAWRTLTEPVAANQRVPVIFDYSIRPARPEQRALGASWSVCYPIHVGPQLWGLVGLDFTTPLAVHDTADLAALQTLASTISDAMSRRELTQRALDERERRLLAERRRAAELENANAALRASLDALATSANEEGFLRQSLLEIARHSHASSAYLFRCDASDGRHRLVGSVRADEFRTEGWPTDPPMFRQGFELLPSLRAQLVPHGRLLWRSIDRSSADDPELPESTRWHLREGHAANALHALLVGERVVGLVGLTFDSAVPLTQAEEELVHALVQPLALLVELSRLARLTQRSAEQNAVLAERNRLARELHDGIAQSFLAIQMQMRSLHDAVQELEPVARAIELARHGLTEARRAVAALRPHELLNRDLPSGLRRLVAQIMTGQPSAVTIECPTTWQRLSLDAEDHLYRIAQEALNNVVKHAQARNVRVELSQVAEEVSVLIADDGAGFDAANLLTQYGARDTRTFGLEGMQQRARLIGANVDWVSAPGRGTQVLVSYPIPPSAEKPDANG